MTDSALPEPLEALPIPEDAIWVDPARLAALPASLAMSSVATSSFATSAPTTAAATAAGGEVVGPAAAERRVRRLAVAALQQELAERQLALPFGPESAFDDPERLLQLNHIALQLVCGGWLEDPFAIPVAPWQQQATAPQLLIAARVEEESGLVRLAAVLTGQEWLQAADQAEPATMESLPVGVAAAGRRRAAATAGPEPEGGSDGVQEGAQQGAVGDELAAIEPALLLPLEQLRGDLERLLVLVQLCAPGVGQAQDAAALPRLSQLQPLLPQPLLPQPLLPRLALPRPLLRRAGLKVQPSRPGEGMVRVRDWLQEQLDPALMALGALLEPRLEPGFRAASALGDSVLEDCEEALAVLVIPLGLDPEGQLCWGEAASSCLERFRLLLIPMGSVPPEPGGSRPPLGEPRLPLQSGALRLEGLLLRLEPDLPGDLLPDGLTLEAEQDSIRQSLVSAASRRLTLRFPASEALIQARLTSPGSAPLLLPALQVPR